MFLFSFNSYLGSRPCANPVYRPTLTIILDQRRLLASGLYPVKLCITFRMRESNKSRWERKYYRIAEAGLLEFNAAISRPRSFEQKQLAAKISEARKKAEHILDKNEFLSSELFDRLFTGVSGESVGSVFAQVIDELMEFDQVSTAASYRTAAGSFKSFAEGDFYFQEITPDWLRRYEKWMKESSPTTASIYLRCLRAVFNRAITQKLISADFYPFKMFRIKKVVKPKQALTAKQKDQVLRFKDDKLQRAVDFWIFSYFCNGMNFADICQLRRRDIHDDTIYLDRAKTIRTNQTLKKIEIPMRKEVKAIIARYGNKSLNPSDYVFPVLREGLTPLQRRYKIQAFTGEVNDDLRIVARKLGFDFRFTTYTARHTFATISVREGASKALIQEALGHSSMQTTENYLAGFDRETKKRMSERL